jgi:hypothetical protein
MNLWAAQWHSRTRMDGELKHFLYEDGIPVLFKTRREAREYINQRYGYIRDRIDLRQEPHGWRIPTALKVTLELTLAGSK